MTEDLQRILWPKGHRPDIWAIVDAAQDQQVYWTLTNSFLPHSCLFAGALPQALEMAAPYLVQLDPEDKLTAYLAKNLSRNLAIFLQTDASLRDLRHHLRTFLTVKDPAGKRMLFRYYDPRVLRVYLPTCSSNELQTVYGPVTSFWTVSETPDSVTQFEYRGKGLKVTPLALGKEELGEELAPVIVPAQDVIAIPKGRTGHRRVPVLLQGAGKGGTLRRSSPAIRFFRTVSAPEELAFPGGAYAVPPSGLDPDITVYAEAASAAEVTLTLEGLRGAKTEKKILAIELTLDSGAAEVCTGTSPATRRRVDVLAVQPASFAGRLTLRSSPGSPALTLFQSADSTTAYDLAEGFSFDTPKAPISFWIQGEVTSKTRGDAGLQLSVENSQIAGDSRPVTVVSIAPVTAEIPGTPSRSKRLPEASLTESTNAGSLTLLAGAANAENGIRLRTEVTPAGVGLRWVVSRNADDSETVRGLSSKPLPTMQQTADGAELLTDAAGSFTVRAIAGESEGWGGPSAQKETVLVHAALTENLSTVNGRFCACARVPGTDQFRLHSGTGGVKLEAAVTLTGGGPDGLRGVGAIHGGWVNNIVSDNAGARYKGGKIHQATYTYEKGAKVAAVDFEEGPLLDATSGESRCVAGTEPGGPLGANAVISAQISPATSWKVQDGAALDRTIEQIWRYLECRSYLALWSADAPGQLGILLETGWSFTGDYACNTTKTTRTTVPARLASTGTTPFPALMPGARTAIEAHPPGSGNRGIA
jgi:hypothetical protein